MKTALFAAGVLGLALPSAGQVTSVPPFAGGKTESFEVNGFVAGCWPGRVFADDGDLCSSAANNIYTGLWVWFYTAMGQCYLNPHHGNRVMVIHDGQFEIHFDTPVSRFGGWFSRGLDQSNPVESIEFYDQQGTLIHSELISVWFGCQWEWYGWSAGATPIQLVRVNSWAPIGHVLVIDDLQADFVPPAPMAYCSAGTSSSGCVASISASANPNVAHSSPCQVLVAGVDGQRSGIVFYGLGAQANPWCSIGGSSFLCVKAPTARTGVQSSGGTLGSCDGALGLDWNAFQVGHPNALGAPWVSGEKAYVQAWFRDPPSCNSTSLSNAVEIAYVP